MKKLLSIILLLLAVSAQADGVIKRRVSQDVACGIGDTLAGTNTAYTDNVFINPIVGTAYMVERTATASGKLCTGEIYWLNSVTEDIKMLVWNSSHVLIATSTPISSTTANTWNVFTFDGSVNIVSGQVYYLGWIHSPTNYEPDVGTSGSNYVLQKDDTGTYSSPPTDISGHTGVDIGMGTPSVRIKN